jgi:flagellar hook protein FlgE
LARLKPKIIRRLLMSSLFGSFGICVSGLGAQSDNVKTISSNIANARTPGYKAHQTSFSTLVVGKAGNQTRGVITSQRSNVERQGDLVLTENPGDLAVNGKGTLLVKRGKDGEYPVGCIRTGSFFTDREGYIVNDSGYYLQGQRITGEQRKLDLDTIESVRVREEDLSRKATTELALGGVLNGGATTESDGLEFDTSDVATAKNGDLKYSTTVYDPSGATHSLTLMCGMVDDAGEKDWALAVESSEEIGDFSFLAGDGFSVPYKDGKAVPFKFEDGKVDATDGIPSLKITWRNGQESSLKLDVSKVSLGTSLENLSAEQRGGHSQRSLTGWSLSQENSIEFSYSDGTVERTYQLPLASCINPNALTETSDGVYFKNHDSGDLHLYLPQEDGLGTILSGAQESSTVDIAQELSDAIVTQHIYAANGRIISTISDMLEVLERI